MIGHGWWRSWLPVWGQRWAIEQRMLQLAMSVAARLGGGFGLVCNSDNEARQLQLCLRR